MAIEIILHQLFKIYLPIRAARAIQDAHEHDVDFLLVIEAGYNLLQFFMALPWIPERII